MWQFLYKVFRKKQTEIEHISPIIIDGKEHHICLPLFCARIRPGESDEEKQKAIDDYRSHVDKNEECELINQDEGYRLYHNNGVETSTSLYENLLRFASKPDKAYQVWQHIEELMQFQTNTKGICKPIKAAMDAGAISRPAWNDFLADFPLLAKHTNKSQFNAFLGSPTPPTDRDIVYENYKKEFKELIQ